MTTYNIAICDDDQAFVFSLREQICRILENSDTDYNITEFFSAETLLQYVQANTDYIDLIFLDIFMQSINGVDAARIIRQNNDAVAIIFISSSDQHVFSGYEVQALQYLLKPVNFESLSKALLHDLKKRFAGHSLVFKASGMTCQVPFENIEYIESMLKSVKLVEKNGVHEIYIKISDLENSLPRESFCRCHRSFIVNFKHVAGMNAQSLTIVSGASIPIGKTYTKTVNRAFLNYIGGNAEA